MNPATTGALDTARALLAVDRGDLHDVVRVTAWYHPGRVAAVGPDGELSYADLDHAADHVAARLHALGVGPGDRVVIWAPKGVRVVAAMQGTLRLGAVYVPVDSTAPPARAALIAAACGARVMLVEDDRIDQVHGTAPGQPSALPLSAVDISGAAGIPEPVHVWVDPDAPAYILYTSGSTGTPKGVCLSHRNARAFVDWCVAELGCGPEDRFANHAPFSFDLSVLDLYVAFSVGASVHLIPAELAYAPTELVRFIHQAGISVWYSVPSVLILMAHEGGLLDGPAPAALRIVVFAGEPFPIGPLRRLHAWTGARLLNFYGPTETNVCTYHEVQPADLRRGQPVPIGRASCGDRVWAVRDDGTVADVGEQGELLVDGPTVMLGYWGADPHRGPYRTGDLVRVRDDGGFDYVGRRDHMVKLRGYRVELGEIEAVLAAHPGVEQAVALIVGAGMAARLEVVVVPATGATPSLLQLKRHAAQRLPRYMLPDAVRLVPALPRTPNGKVDRARLTAATTAETGTTGAAVAATVAAGGTEHAEEDHRA